MVILGIDGARTKCGLAVVDCGIHPRLLHSETVRSRSGETMKDSRERIMVRVWALIKEYGCECAGLEAAKVDRKLDEGEARDYQELFLELLRNIQSLHVQARIVGAIEWELERNNFLVQSFENVAHWRQSVGIPIGPHIKRAALKSMAIAKARQLFGVQLNDDEAEAALMAIAASKQVVEL